MESLGIMTIIIKTLLIYMFVIWQITKLLKVTGIKN